MMRVARETVGLVMVLSLACRQEPRDHERAATLPTRQAPIAGDARITAHNPDRALADALAEGYPEEPMSGSEWNTVLSRLSVTDDSDVLRARVMGASRRDPSELLSRLWSAVLPIQADDVARGLTGRARELGPSELPAMLRPAQGAPWSIAAATLVSRMHLTVDPAPPTSTALLTSADPSEQLAGARLLSSPTTTLPDPEVVAVIPPYAWPAIARSLANRPTVPTPYWAALLRTTAERTMLAPRQWANAWGSIRDAAPADRTDLTEALRAATATASLAHLPPQAQAFFRCDNAVVLDRASGWPDEVTRCATREFASTELAAEADVIARSTVDVQRRAQRLGQIIHLARGSPLVLEHAATAALALPVAAAMPLLLSLARERDPGVMAALLKYPCCVQHAEPCGKTHCVTCYAPRSTSREVATPRSRHRFTPSNWRVLCTGPNSPRQRPPTCAPSIWRGSPTRRSSGPRRPSRHRRHRSTSSSRKPTPANSRFELHVRMWRPAARSASCFVQLASTGTTG